MKRIGEVTRADGRCLDGKTLLERPVDAEFIVMIKQRYIYWQDDDAWLGYLEEYPDYWTQGESEAELKEHLIDLYKELASGAIPNVRRTAELDIA